MKIETQTKIFKLRSILNQISDASYAFKTLYQQYPLPTIKTQEDAEKILKAYQEIINQVKNSIQNSENEIPADKH